MEHQSLTMKFSCYYKYAVSCKHGIGFNRLRIVPKLKVELLLYLLWFCVVVEATFSYINNTFTYYPNPTIHHSVLSCLKILSGFTVQSQKLYAKGKNAVFIFQRNYYYYYSSRGV